MTTNRIWIRAFRSQRDETIVVIEDDKEGMYYRMHDSGSKHPSREDLSIDCARVSWKNRETYSEPCYQFKNEMEAASAVAHQFACWIGFWVKS